MGATLKTALNVIGFDKNHYSTETLKEIIKGANEKIQECGGLLMGGHTIESSDMFYGLSATGVVNPKNIIRNNTAQIGDVLVLTKPLGMGTLTNALKKDLLVDSVKNETIEVLETLNYLCAKTLKSYKVSSCITINNQGLLGQILHSTDKINSFAIYCDEVPIIQEAKELFKEGLLPKETKNNMNFFKDKTSIMCASDYCYALFCDAQISGGLLIAMEEKYAKEYIKEIEDLTFGYGKIIGEVIPRGPTPIMIY